MKTRKETLKKKLISTVESMGYVILYYLSEQISFKKDANYKFDEEDYQELFEDFCKGFKKFGKTCYELESINVKPPKEDYDSLLSLLHMIVDNAFSPSPSLNCIQHICKEFIPAFTAFKFNPYGIISSETGEVVYDFRKDTPKTILARFVGKNS